jgi:hypothetical protein
MIRLAVSVSPTPNVSAVEPKLTVSYFLLVLEIIPNSLLHVIHELNSRDVLLVSQLILLFKLP